MAPLMRMSWMSGQRCLQRLEARAEAVADLRGAVEQAVLLDGLDGGQGGAAGDRVAAEGRRVRAGDELLGELRLGQQAAAGDAAGQRLGQRDRVGLRRRSAERRTTCPVRPMPVCTSSKISISLCLSASSRSPSR